jgi:uncharacterized protein (TIGR02145 family)
MENVKLVGTFYFLAVFLLSLSACNKDDPEPVFERGTVIDFDGNIYKTVKIGSQEWMAENLYAKTFRTGTEISYIGRDTLAWMNHNAPAYSWYQDDERNRTSYGALYNWYTVQNQEGLCPDGWRVFTRHDWNKLLRYLMKRHRLKNDPIDNPNAIGKMLKSCRQVNSPLAEGCKTDVHPRWNSHPVYYGTNDYEFAALPGGIRRDTGSFYGRGSYGLWWDFRCCTY